MNILKSIFEGLLAAVIDWWKAEEAESAKWAAEARKQQMESLKSGLEKQEELRKHIDTVQPITSPSGWRTRSILPLLLILPLAGCFRFYVAAERYVVVPPKILASELPALTEAEIQEQQVAIKADEEAPFSARETALATYAAKLEAAYVRIREESISQNRRNGYPIQE